MFLFLKVNIIWSVAIVYSLSDQFEANKTTDEDNAFSLCTNLSNCFKSCRNYSIVELECQSPSFINNISTCACSDLHCSRLKSWCLLGCKGESTVSETCVECILHNDSDACSQACFSSGTCTLREDCDDTFCRACAPGSFGARCDQKCAEKCRGRCFGESGYCRRCERGKFGRMCEQNCSAHCHRTSCMPETGLCRSCVPGYVGTTCNQTCSKGYFGPKCSRTCSVNCINATCDHVTGRCLRGCVPGFFNVFCDKMCPGGNYGEGCLANCPVTCSAKENKSPCDHATGACLNGCNEGFRGDQCNIPCSDGRYGRNCERNCSDQCFLHVCNSFSGLCLRCEAGRDGPFCEDVKAAATKVSDIVDTEISTDKVILIFITLFVMGTCAWFTLAGSMYHRRKLMWQKIWETGKLPSHYRLPRIWKQPMLWSSISPIQRFHSLRKFGRSPEARRDRRRKEQRKRLISSESSEESNTSSDSLTSIADEQDDAVQLSSKDKAPEDVGQGGGDTVPKVPFGANMQVVGVHSTAMLQENVADGPKLETHPRISDSNKMAVKPFTLSLNTQPWQEKRQSRVLEESGTSSTSKLTSNTVQVGTGSQDDILSGRSLKLLKKTTRTTAVRELESSATRYHITTTETRTSTKARLISGRVSTLKIDSETANDTTTPTESETNRSTETEVETTSETETLSDTSHSSTSASTITVKPKPLNKAMEEILKTNPPLLIKDNLESPRSKQWSIPRPLLPTFRSKPPTPIKPQGLLKKGFNFLSNIIPTKVTGPKPRKELSPMVMVTDKAHMSSRFLLTRLDDWRRTREKELEIKEGFVEVNDEKKKASKKKSSTLASSVEDSTTTSSMKASTTSSSRVSGETETTTGRSSSSTTKTSATTASTATSSSDRPSGTSHKSDTSSSSRSHRHGRGKLRRKEESTTSGSRTTSSPTTMDSSFSTSGTSGGNTNTSGLSIKTPKTISFTEPSMATESKVRPKAYLPSISESSRGSTVESRTGLKRRARSPSHESSPTLHHSKKDMGRISSAFPKTTLKALHEDALEKLARFEAPRGENQARYGRRKRQKERPGVISYHGARKPVKRFRENTSPTLGVSSSTQNVSRTIGNQSTVPSSFSTGATTDTGS